MIEYADHKKLVLDLDAFAGIALEEESARLGVSIEELVGFSVLYYLADRDSGRIARHLPVSGSSPKPTSASLEELLDS